LWKSPARRVEGMGVREDVIELIKAILEDEKSPVLGAYYLLSWSEIPAAQIMEAVGILKVALDHEGHICQFTDFGRRVLEDDAIKGVLNA